MKIARAEVYRADLPFAGGLYELSGGRTYASFDATYVRLITDTGMEGWGESTPFGATYIEAFGGGVRAALEALCPVVIGLDPVQLDRVNDAMDGAMVGQLAAKAAIDVACWDLFGKAVGRPVCDLMGGRVPGPVPVISSIHTGDPEDMRARVAEHRARGFLGHSVKVGAAETEGGPALDAERLSACLADRRPGEWYLADANGGMTPEHALRFLALVPDGVDFVLEAPCATWRETLSLRRRCSVPILLDELVQDDQDLAHAIAEDACDGIGLKISKQGGLTRSRRQRDMARAAGMVVSVQETTGSEIAFAAILHAAQSTPRNILRCALDTRAVIARRMGTFDAPVRDGGAEAPDLPGLGVTPDMNQMGDPVLVVEA
ncbi:MAG: mandelate racemase/muconate lactonizing enzyme family protein [Pseudomonadota bacterium]